jgi:hypothetical protein
VPNIDAKPPYQVNSIVIQHPEDRIRVRKELRVTVSYTTFHVRIHDVDTTTLHAKLQLQ